MPGTAYDNGNPISNFDPTGKVLLLEFWANVLQLPGGVAHTYGEGLDVLQAPSAMGFPGEGTSRQTFFGAARCRR